MELGEFEGLRTFPETVQTELGGYLPSSPYLRSLFFPGPKNRRDYLRLLFLREVVLDPDGPFPQFLLETRQRVREMALKEAFLDYERRRATAKRAGRVESLARPTEADIEEIHLEDAIEHVSDEGELERLAEHVAAALHLQSMPHQWFTDAVSWEGLDKMWGHPMSLLSPWRQSALDPPREVDLTVLVYADEPEDAARRRLDDAKKRLREIRRRAPGPERRLPSDELLIRLLYRNLKGDSCQSLASALASTNAVHEKTLGRYFRQVKGNIFSTEQ